MSQTCTFSEINARIGEVHSSPERTSISRSAQVRKVPILLRKSFWGVERKFLEPLMRFMRGNVRGPYRFIQNRSRTSAVALKSDAAAEKSKDQLSRDFPGRSIFDFCNNICHNRTPAPQQIAALLKYRVSARKRRCLAYC
jgi:hypothetical protein